MFFGPAHTLTQYSSLPRRSHLHAAMGGAGGAAGPLSGSAFQRNTPIRRSTGIPEHHMEYFVPRSISEFNLSGVGDLALPPPRRFSPNINAGMNPGMGMTGMAGMGGMGGMGMANMGVGMGVGGMGGMGLPHGLQLGPPQTLLCPNAAAAASAPPPPPAQLQIVQLKPRSEKMVTFEDESKQNGSSQAVTCPHGVPTTPRKSLATGGGVGGDMFM